MSRIVRLGKIEERLKNQRFVSRDGLLRELEVSRATLDRDIAMLRDRFGMAPAWDRDRHGWYQPHDGAAGAQFEIPHLYFSADESRALLTMIHLLSNPDADGLLGTSSEAWCLGLIEARGRCPLGRRR